MCKADFKSGNAPEKIQIACASKSTRSASTEHSDRTTSGTSQVAELDEIERRVSHLVQSLCEEDAAALVVCHVKGNMYKINGRRVRLSLSRRAAVMVQEDFDALPLVPLETYLQQAVFVSRALHGLSIGSPAVAQVPANRRLTFAAIDAADAESSRRVKAMRLACEEARLRQEAAEAYARESAEKRRFGDESAAADLQTQGGSPEASAAEVAVTPEALTLDAACT